MGKKYFLFLIVICVIAVAVDIYTAHKYTIRLTEAIDQRKLDFFKLYEYTTLLSNLKDAETGQRGFIISGKESYLTPYYSALDYLNSSKYQTFIKEKLADPSMMKVERTQYLVHLIKEIVDDMKEGIQIRKEQGLEVAQAFALSHQGTEIMDEIRSLIQSIINEQLIALEKDTTEIQEATGGIINEFILGDLLEIILIGICLFFFYRSISRLAKNEKELSLAKSQLTESLSMLKSIFDASHFSIMATDTKGIITAFNPAAEQLLGYSSEELVGKKTPELFHSNKEIEAKTFDIFKRHHEKVEGFARLTAFLKESSHDTSEWTYVRKDGTTFPALRSLTTIKDPDKKIIGYVGIIQDITEQKKIDKLKDELMAIAAFELREPIAAIKGTFDLLSSQANSLPEKTQRVLEIGKRNCMHLINVMKDIFEMQKIETGKESINLRKIDLKSILAIVVQNQTALANQAHIGLDYHPPLKAAIVNADPDRLIHVLEHLIADSIRRSSPQGTIAILADHMGGADEDYDQGPNPFEVCRTLFAYPLRPPISSFYC